MRMPRRFGGDEGPNGSASTRPNGVLGQTWRVRYEPPVPSFRRDARCARPGRHCLLPVPLSRFDRMHVVDMVFHWARIDPHRPAIILPELVTTYAGLADAVDSISRRIDQLG